MATPKDHQPVGHGLGSHGRRAGKAHATDRAAIDLDPIRPAEGHGNHRRDQGAEAIREAKQGNQNDRQGRLERLFGREHDCALAHLLADAPQQRARLGALGGELEATLEWREVG
jgi:hypothetical protein